MSEFELADLQLEARSIRSQLIEISHETKTPHLGSALSCIEILVAAYWGGLKINPTDPHHPGRDRFILSKGHAILGQYIALQRRGFISAETLATFGQDGSLLGEHPIPNSVPGVELATGSLGHGLSVGLGLAMAAKLQKQSYRVFVTMSDGEVNEGSVWEAALMAPQQSVGNLVAFIDYNKWQATGRSNEVLSMSPLKAKWEAFGWDVFEVDGHDLSALTPFFKLDAASRKRPTMVVANTLKGKGVSFMEDNNDWHYRIPTAEDVAAAKKELGLG